MTNRPTQPRSRRRGVTVQRPGGRSGPVERIMQARPWCYPCWCNEGSAVSAQFLGVACEWHWGILSESDQQALTAAVAEKHPRGGRVSTVGEQIWVVRVTLRRGDNTVEKTWRDEWAESRE